jgi:cytochrome bd-type quinol oxidase subunit 2
VRHSLDLEAALVVTLYCVYELARGLVVGNAREADRHAGRVVALERSLHLFVEGKVQHAADVLPGLTGLLGVAYLTLHFAVTAAVLLWLHQRRPTAYPFVRTTLLVASALALVGFIAYPTAPPRLAGIDIADTVSNGYVNLNHGLVSPSEHARRLRADRRDQPAPIRRRTAHTPAWDALPSIRLGRCRRHR